MSVWQSIADLEAFVYKGSHVEVLRRRKEWFSKMKFYMVMWWIPAGNFPTLEEGKKKLEQIEKNGPPEYAFDFKKQFAPPENIIAEKA